VRSAKSTRVVLRGRYGFLARKAKTFISKRLELKEEFGEEVLALSLLMSYTYIHMELLVKPEILTSYIQWTLDLRTQFVPEGWS
jgi:hypothetical protein